MFRLCIFSVSCALRVTMFRIAVLLAGVSLGVQTQHGAKQALEERCYSVGRCMPLDEPTGDARYICKIFEESVTCMQRAMEACRQLDFPPDTLASSELKIKDLRHNLDLHCSDDVTRVKATSSNTEKISEAAEQSESGETTDEVAGNEAAPQTCFSPFLWLISLVLSSLTLLCGSDL